jgi:hypothetical protein
VPLVTQRKGFTEISVSTLEDVGVAVNHGIVRVVLTTNQCSTPVAGQTHQSQTSCKHVAAVISSRYVSFPLEQTFSIFHTQINIAFDTDTGRLVTQVQVSTVSANQAHTERTVQSSISLSDHRSSHSTSNSQSNQ